MIDWKREKILREHGIDPATVEGKSLRELGLNPKALGTNPRALGLNPRARKSNPRRRCRKKASK
jgi:hypothetical protein